MFAFMDAFFKHPYQELLQHPEMHKAGINALLDWSIEKGFEGLMFRYKPEGYKTGQRTKWLLKLKKVKTGEYRVLEISTDKNGYGVLHLKHKGRFFEVSAPGDEYDRAFVADSPSDFVGKDIAIEYYEMTEKGTPFHPIATHWREDHKE